MSPAVKYRRSRKDPKLSGCSVGALVVSLRDYLLQTLYLKGGQNAHGLGAPGQIAVIIATAVAQPPPLVIKAHAGQDDRIQLTGVYQPGTLRDRGPDTVPPLFPALRAIGNISFHISGGIAYGKGQNFPLLHHPGMEYG